MDEDDKDILERNDELNNQVAVVAQTFTRRKVVDTLLTIIIAIILGVGASLLYVDHHLETKINDTAQDEIQLICFHLSLTDKITALPLCKDALVQDPDTDSGGN